METLEGTSNDFKNTKFETESSANIITGKGKKNFTLSKTIY